MRQTLLATCALAGLCACAHAQTTLPLPPVLLKSHTIFASGPCTGQDVVGAADYGWEPGPITVLGAEIVVMGDTTDLQYAFAGNSYTPDVMVWLGTGMNRVVNMFPSGTGMAFPAENTPEAQPAPGLKPLHHIDFHYSCAVPPGQSATFQGFETIYYVLGAPAGAGQ